MIRTSALCLVAILALSPAALWADARDDAALVLFTRGFSGTCGMAFAEDGTPFEPPQRFEVSLASSYGEPEPGTLWQFFCDAGAYNFTSVFVVETEIDGMRPLALPQPVLQVVNEDPENFESPVKEIVVTGWTATFRAINASFDPATGMISAVGKWRGLGDAYDASTFVLRDGGAHLTAFEADGSYDDEVKPQLVLSFPTTGP